MSDAHDPADAGMDNPPDDLIERLRAPQWYPDKPTLLEAADALAALQQRVEELERERIELYNERHLFLIDKERQALEQRVVELELQLEHALEVAEVLKGTEARERVLREALTEFGSNRVRDRIAKAVGCNADILQDALQQGVRAALSAHKDGGTNVPENEEGQCAEWPRCACGRGGPDLCCECISQETCNCVSPDAYGRKHDADV